MTDTKSAMMNAKGHFVPMNLIAAADRLENDVVNTIVGHAKELSDRIARFKGHTFDDVNSAVALMAEEYGVTKGGRKGNMTFTSYDGCRKVQVSIADNITFGPQLQIAKALIDECIEDWSDGSRDEIKVLINHAFNVDKEGVVNREALFSLRRMNISHPKWIKAMDAISDSIRVIGSKSYIRVYERENSGAGWELIQLNIAAV